MESIKGMVFNIQRYSIDDGPGSGPPFFKGLPIAVPLVFKPGIAESLSEIAHRNLRASGAAGAWKLPGAGHFTHGGRDPIDRNLCDNCGECVSECPHEG